MSAENLEAMQEKEKSPEDGFYAMYLNATGEEDAFLPGSWEANTGNILTFTGLFAATVAAFLIESYKSLSPDSGDQTTFLLQQLLAATANMSTNAPVNIVPQQPFQAPPTSILVNALWFSSLLISLVCALLSTLIQEWAREYRRNISQCQRLDVPVPDRALNHICFRMGIDRYGMDRTVYLITAFVHLSVLLFAIGLVIFLIPINDVVAGVAVGVLGVLLTTYVVASLLPLLDASCPYRTPATYFAAAFLRLFMIIRSSFVVTRSGTRWSPTVTGTAIVTQPSGGNAPRLTVKLFEFAWSRTSSHMTSTGQQFFKLAESTLAVMHATWRGDWPFDGLLSVLWSERLFIHRVYVYLEQTLLSSSNEPLQKPVLDMVVLLSQSMFVFDEDRRYHERDGVAVKYYFDALTTLGAIARGSKNAKQRIEARLCLAAVRNHFCEAYEAAHERGLQKSSDPSPSQMYLLLTEYSRRHAIDYQKFATELFHPEVALLLTDHEVLDRVPIHDRDCCQLAKSDLLSVWKKSAMSDALAVISGLLQVDDATRDSVEIPEWLVRFHLDPQLCAMLCSHRPSPEFIETMRRAGSNIYRPYFRRRGKALVRILDQFATCVDWERQDIFNPLAFLPRDDTEAHNTHTCGELCCEQEPIVVVVPDRADGAAPPAYVELDPAASSGASVTTPVPNGHSDFAASTAVAGYRKRS